MYFPGQQAPTVQSSVITLKIASSVKKQERLSTPAAKFLPQLLQLCHRKLVRLVRDCHAHLRTWNQATIAPNSYSSVSGVCCWSPLSWAAHLKTHLINSNSSNSNHKSACFLIHLRFCGLLSRWREEDFINAKQPPGIDAHVFQLLVDHKVTSQQGALWLPLSLCLSTSLPSFPYYICLRVYPPICLAFSLPLYLSTYCITMPSTTFAGHHAFMNHWLRLDQVSLAYNLSAVEKHPLKGAQVTWWIGKARYLKRIKCQISASPTSCCPHTAYGKIWTQ